MSNNRGSQRLRPGVHLYRLRTLLRVGDRFGKRYWKIMGVRGTHFPTLLEAKKWVDERYEAAAKAAEAAKQEISPPPSDRGGIPFLSERGRSPEDQ